MFNLNKLFPRLSIRRKLIIAFAAAAVVPLSITSFIGMRETLRQIQGGAANTLTYRLQLAEARTARSLAAAQSHVVYLASDVLGSLLTSGDTAAANRARDVARRLIDTEPTLYQVRLLGRDGDAVLVARSSAAGEYDDAEDESGLYYTWRAEELERGEERVIPIELRGGTVPNAAGATVAALAIIVPVEDAQGRRLGVVVGELSAAVLFQHLDQDTAGPVHTVGLVDREGLFLYHSQRKRDWSMLVASHNDETLFSDYPAEAAAKILGGGAGSVLTPDGTLVSYRPLHLDRAGVGALTLYYAVPHGAFVAPTRRFLMQTASGGVLVLTVVLISAVIAAHQFTNPILRLRSAAQRLTREGRAPTIDVNTNDELEDLARDFRNMAQTIADHREQLQQLVTERTRLLEQTQAQFADVLAHSADAIVSTDGQGAVVAWNRGAERLFGYRGEEAIGRSLDSLIGPRGPGAERETFYLERELAAVGEVVNFATERLAKDGTTRPVTLTQTRHGSIAHGDRAASLILRDTRLQTQVDTQLRRSERLAAVSVLAAGLAHEINTPLAIIGNRIECMQRDARDAASNPELRRDLDVLAAHVARLTDVTTGLLRFARDDDQSVERVLLQPCVERVARLFERTLAMRKLRLECRVQTSPLSVIGNQQALETVIVNLLMNAADATPPGGQVTLELRSPEAGTAELLVTDTGSGVAFELRDRVFEPFFTTKPAHLGTGLGLTVCRSIVERLGGSIRLNAAHAGGASFVVTLPNASDSA